MGVSSKEWTPIDCAGNRRAMSIFFDVTIEDRWLTLAGGLRQHAQLRIAEMSLNQLVGYKSTVAKFNLTRGVFLQEHLLQHTAPPSKLLIKTGILDASGLAVRVALTIRTSENGKGLARCLFGIRATEDSFSLRRALKQMLADAAVLWDDHEEEESRTLLPHVPLSGSNAVPGGREWTYLCSL